jgi:hypothetical protein
MSYCSQCCCAKFRGLNTYDVTMEDRFWNLFKPLKSIEAIELSLVLEKSTIKNVNAIELIQFLAIDYMTNVVCW